jgi:hypothetical protein
MLFSLEYETDDDLVAQLRKAIIEREEWLTPKQVRTRYNLHSATLTRRLQRWQKQGLIDLDANSVMRGPTGRILKIKITPEIRREMISNPVLVRPTRGLVASVKNLYRPHMVSKSAVAHILGIPETLVRRILKNE